MRQWQVVDKTDSKIVWCGDRRMARILMQANRRSFKADKHQYECHVINE